MAPGLERKRVKFKRIVLSTNEKIEEMNRWWIDDEWFHWLQILLKWEFNVVCK